ncbi:MAG: hypothetical protein U9Q89_07320 [Thermodesulfobacteriota bacterium]|nr:hypothetical protein [Thermodesulfobacteriota bacterium]
MRKALIVDDIPEYVDTMETYLEDRFDVLTGHWFFQDFIFFPIQSIIIW